MFCFQCQETAGNKGCTLQGVCGKKPEVAQLQDLLVWTTKGLCAVTSRLHDERKTIDKEINHLITQNLFITITNANFDASAITKAIEKTLAAKETLLSQLTNKSKLPDAATWTGDKDTFSTKAATIGILSSMKIDEDIRSLRELITYGLKGLAAYMKHANALLFDKAELDAFVQRALASTLDDSLSLDALVTLTMETGKAGVDVMALLDKANTSRYGNPEITKVNLGVRNNPGILISGHDLKDLEMLLEQTQDTGVDVYTHSEMLPAHYYPAFKKYPHFVGNYGNAWWKQREEFESFNGPILMTTNCIVPPLENAKYLGRLWTTGTAGLNPERHIPGKYGEKKDFSAIIAQAKNCPSPTPIETGTITGGFAHNQLLALSDKIIAAVKSTKTKPTSNWRPKC